MKVYLVRHTSVLLDGNVVCYGATDVDVRESFEQEAEVTKKLISDRSFSAVFTSPLKRARKLADYCGYPDAIQDDRLKEFNFGEWETRPWNQIIYEHDVAHFFHRYLHDRVPGGESLTDQQNRVIDFLREQKAKGYESILVFCHGGIINCARAAVRDFTLEQAFEHLPGFGSVTPIEF